MAETNYTQPVSQLVTLGAPKNQTTNPLFWRNYLELGIGPENIPDLIRLATDKDLEELPTENLAVWGPMHAWRTLGQLKAEEAIEPLLSLFERLQDDDWAGEELPAVYGMIGPKAIPTLSKYLAENNKVYWLPIQASASLTEIAQRHPETRAEVVDILTKQLKKTKENDPILNGFIISDLIDLKAVDSLPAIEQAFRTGNVDTSVAGDYREVAAEMTAKPTEPTAKKPSLLDAKKPLPLKTDYEASVRDGQERTKAQKEKAKAKRKMAAASRKKNRKR